MTPPLQLDPGIASGWVSPRRYRVGCDTRILELRDPSRAELTVLALLRQGTSARRLRETARDTGMSEADLTRLLGRLAPALRRSPPPATASCELRLTLAGALGDCAEVRRELCRSFRFHGFRLVAAGPPPPGSAVVCAARYFPPFRLLHALLGRDLTVVPVLFSDGGVRIGPVLGAPRGCCVDCATGHERARDPAWPAFAALHGDRTTASESAEALRQTPPLVAHLLRAPGATPATSDRATLTQWFLPATAAGVTGPPERRTVHPVAACPCGSVPGSVAGSPALAAASERAAGSAAVAAESGRAADSRAAGPPAVSGPAARSAAGGQPLSAAQSRAA